MISECPSCQTRFRVTEEQLAVSHGRVRCGACLAVFDGREAMVTETKEAPVDDPVGVLLETTGPAAAEEALEEPSEPTRDRPTHPVAFAAAIAAAMALVAAGVMTLQYEVLVQHPVLRDAYEVVGVEVPRYKALGAIRVANQSVGERSGEDLIVRLDLANTAPRHQRFPTLAVRFHRADGVLLPEQRVEPAAYLPSPNHSRRMTSNTTTSVLLRLDDPGPEAVSYSISLL